jgi:hypothetical protein
MESVSRQDAKEDTPRRKGGKGKRIFLGVFAYFFFASWREKIGHLTVNRTPRKAFVPCTGA